MATVMINNYLHSTDNGKRGIFVYETILRLIIPSSFRHFKQLLNLIFHLTTVFYYFIKLRVKLILSKFPFEL